MWADIDVCGYISVVYEFTTKREESLDDDDISWLDCESIWSWISEEIIVWDFDSLSLFELPDFFCCHGEIERFRMVPIELWM